MENLLFLLKGITLGIVIGFPSGPVGFLFIKRAATDGFMAGLTSGIGSTVAHIVFSIILFFSYSKVLEIYQSHEKIVTFFFSFFLIILGLFIYKAKKKKDFSEDNVSTLYGYIVSAFGITITNPMVFIQFTLLFPFLNITKSNYFQLSFLIFGLIIGSLFWPTLSSIGISKIRHSIPNQKIINLQKIIGVIIITIGLFYILKCLI